MKGKSLEKALAGKAFRAPQILETGWSEKVKKN